MMRMQWSILVLAMATQACGDGSSVVRPDAADAITSPYAQWSRGPSTDPSYFPIGVWVQSPSNAARYKEIGVKLYVGLWQGPTDEQLDALTQAGMKVICAQNQVGLERAAETTIVGWMHGDEPDNAQALPEGGYGPAIDPAVLQADYERMRVADPTRPVWLNLGQGVANENWIGRGGPREDYPRYVATTDIVSYDVYPVSGVRRDDGEQVLWWVAKGVDSLQAWAARGQPVWNVIETTRINSERGPTPAQVRSQVWMSIVAGSTGIIYFCHEWNPVFREARLLEDEPMRVAVGHINAQIQRLAPVLNGVTVTERVQISSQAEDTPVRALVKRHAGDLWIISTATRLGDTLATFAVSGAGSGSVEVVDEGRSLPMSDGVFEDEFAADYSVHIYRIVGAG